MRALGAERADIEGVRAQRHGERGIVELGIMGQGHHRGAAVGLEALQRLVRPFGRDGDTGKALVAGEGGARIDHGHEIARQRRHPRHRLRDVDGAHQDAAQARVEHLDEDRRRRVSTVRCDPRRARGARPRAASSSSAISPDAVPSSMKLCCPVLRSVRSAALRPSRLAASARWRRASFIRRARRRPGSCRRRRARLPRPARC